MAGLTSAQGSIASAGIGAGASLISSIISGVNAGFERDQAKKVFNSKLKTQFAQYNNNQKRLAGIAGALSSGIKSPVTDESSAAYGFGTITSEEQKNLTLA